MNPFETKILSAASILLCLVSFAAGQSSKPVTIPDPDALDAYLDKYVDQGGYPFLYARLEDKEGRVIYEHSVKNKALLPTSKIDGDTWIRIWSMSKIITISVLLDLVEDGKVKLDDPVTKYIPEFKNLKVAVSEKGADLSKVKNEDKKTSCPIKQVPIKNQMTVLHLINHQAGFYYATTGMPCLDSPVAAQNLPIAKNSKELVDRIAKLPLIQQPGTSDYYGTNTTVLGIVAERATGKSLKQLVKERVTGTLKIKGLRYGLPKGANLLPRYSGKDVQLRIAKAGELDIFGPSFPKYDAAHELYLGGEGMVATADGYADFLRMLLNRGTLNGKRFLNKSTVEDITSPHTQLESEYGYNGYNLWINSGKLGSGKMGEGGLWIGGGYEGTHFWIDPKREFVGVIMTQMFWLQPKFYGRDDGFREEVYKQLRK